MQWLIDKLESGESVTLKAPGNSMTPIVKRGEPVTLIPIGDRTPVLGDIVLARVKGNLYIHKVSAADYAKNRYQISNNHGHINGWTSRNKIYGIVTSHHA